MHNFSARSLDVPVPVPCLLGLGSQQASLRRLGGVGRWIVVGRMGRIGRIRRILHGADGSDGSDFASD